MKKAYLPNQNWKSSEKAPPDLSVDCSGGTGYTQEGERIVRSAGAVDQSDCSVDKNGASTQCTNGYERILSIFVTNARAESDPRVDGHGNTVYFNQDDGHLFEVEAGTEVLVAATPTAPTLRTDALLLCDILIQTVGAVSTSVITGYGTALGNIDLTRTEYWERTAKFISGLEAIVGELTVNDWIELTANLGVAPALAAKKTYSEALPYAWATIDADGAIINSYNIVSSARLGAGVYEVTIAADYTFALDICPIVNAGVNSLVATCLASAPTKIQVLTYDSTTGVANNATFNLVIFGRMAL